MKALSLLLRVFKGMESFWDFFTSCLASVPEELASDEHLFADELPNPKRMRLDPPMPARSGDSDAAAREHAAQRKIANMFNNLDDVANLADLQGFDELDTDPASQSPIS